MNPALTINVLMSKWLQDVVVAAADLLAAVENADDVLVSDDIKESAARLRIVIEEPKP